jgi:hypothetical protein
MLKNVHMPTTAKSRQSEDENASPFETVTRWGLVVLAVIAATGALFRIFNPATIGITQGLDQTTLLYLMVAGGLLLLKQIKTFSLGQLKLEMIEKMRERQDRQEERLADIQLILPLLLPENEVKHIRNLFGRVTDGYKGSHSLRTELRRLASIGLLKRKAGRNIAEMKDDTKFDLGEYLELTDLGRRWAVRIQEIEAGGEKRA